MQALSLSNPLLSPVLAEIKSRSITNKLQIAQILAQLHKESGGFVLDEHGLVHAENLHYSPDVLLKNFHTHFTSLQDAISVVSRGVEAIGNRVYADRMGNGNEASGDGYRCRGRGYIQITGKDNYAALTLSLDHDFLSAPDDLCMPEWAAKSALWFVCEYKPTWLDHASKGDCTECTHLINGGLNGLDDRIALYKQYLAQL